MKVEICIDSSKRHEDGLAAIAVRVPELELDYALDVPFKGLYERYAIPDWLTLDFLIVAALCYVIDKVVPRKSAADHWTRELEVEFPVSAPDVWKGVAGDLETALSFLSGDVWQVSFRKSESPLFRLQRLRSRRRRRLLVPRMGRATAVCLFSGGLDSLAGAIDLLAAEEKQKVLLSGHYDIAGPRSQQQNLFAEIRKQYSGRAELLQTRVGNRPDEVPENTFRSRSLVFMALGIYAARASGPGVPLYAPENGLIAMNIPLTPSRSGSCSTRTMHPFFLDKLRSALSGLGFRNTIINPFELKTKGECIVECRNQILLKSLVEASVSCSHGTRRQNWVRRGAKNCGYCVPCMNRRAALHKAGLDEGRKYGIDICEGELPIDDEGDSADDLRAMLDFLLARRSAEEISRDIRSIAPVRRLPEYAAMVERGFEEIRSLIRDKAKPSIRRAAGIVSPKK
jgi:7-cyano-7-deazaguanine synthase in queuosine biosynthesis